MSRLQLAILCTLLTPVLHIVVLANTAQSAVSTPISELSRQQWGALHSAGLVLFGSAHLLLALALRGLDRGRLWPVGRAMLAGSGLTLWGVAAFFTFAEDATLRGPEASDPLWVLASLIGFSMGLLQPGLSRLGRGVSRFNALCLTAWLLLIPLALFAEQWIGAYERTVGSIYVLWMLGISGGMLLVARHHREHAATARP